MIMIENVSDIDVLFTKAVISGLCDTGFEFITDENAGGYYNDGDDTYAIIKRIGFASNIAHIPVIQKCVRHRLTSFINKLKSKPNYKVIWWYKEIPEDRHRHQVTINCILGLRDTGW